MSRRLCLCAEICIPAVAIFCPGQGLVYQDRLPAPLSNCISQAITSVPRLLFVFDLELKRRKESALPSL